MKRPIALGLASVGSAPSGPRAASEMTAIVTVPRASNRQVRPVDRLAPLRNHPLFREFPPAVIENLGAYMTRRSVPRGATIFAKGDPGSALIALLWGSVKISVSTNGGHEALLNIINAGQAFGEIALLDGQPRTADAVAMTDCELMVIDRRDFIPVLRREPDVALKLIETLCARIRRTSEQVEDVMYLSLPTRLAKTLLELAGGLAASATQRNVRMTQRELGNIIGMSRESTNKQLRAWEERKWVGLERGGIVLMNAGALGKLIGEEIQTIV
jgi:CRP/FNR family transcriptional regulator, cyclic AMP receptor protein